MSFSSHKGNLSLRTGLQGWSSDFYLRGGGTIKTAYTEHLHECLKEHFPVLFVPGIVSVALPGDMCLLTLDKQKIRLQPPCHDQKVKTFAGT